MSLSLFATAHAVAQRANALWAETAAGTAGGVTLTQALVLEAVTANPACSQTAIVAATGIDRSTLADVVRRLLKKGLLQRRRTREDARAYAVKITAAGEAALVEARSIASAAAPELRRAAPGISALKVPAPRTPAPFKEAAE